ncbi:MAG: 3-deoxy-manno-octulosonate cytidylyltransferase [Myxococcota bacterium]
MPVAIVIPARYASSRFPGKAIAAVAGRPLVEHVWRGATAWGGAIRVLVATDDDRVARVARAFGAEVALGGEARTGSDRVARVGCELGADIVVNVQGDEIDVDREAIDGAILALEGADIGTVACALESRDHSDRDAVKVVTDTRGFALHFSRAALAGAQRHVGVYAFRAHFLRVFASLPTGALERAEGLEQLRAIEHGHRIRVTRLLGNYRSINREENLGNG